jgi:hypothetical protein
MNQRTLLKSVGLLVLVYVMLLAMSLQFGGTYVEFLLPLYRWELSHLAQDFELQSLMLGDNKGESVVALSMFTKYSVINNQVIPSGISISCSTLIGHALQHPLLIFSLVFAWPATSLGQIFTRLCCALPFLILMETLDIPLLLLGSAQDLILANFTSGSDSFIVGWMNLLNGGGRPALSIFAAMMALVCSKFFHSRHR